MTTVRAKYLGGLRVECEHLQSGAKIVTDAPVDNHGKGEAFSPTDLCATSLAACMMTTMGIYAETIGIDLTGTEIERTKKMALEPHRRIGEVEIVFHMPDREYSDKHKIALERTKNACAVHFSLNENLIQNVKFIWKR